MTNGLLEQLSGGDLRSIGNANEVAKQINDDQKLFDEVFNGIFDDDPIIRMRSSDVIEKISKQHPHLLKKHKKRIIKYLHKFDQQEVKWHIAQILSYSKLSKIESEKTFTVLSK